MRFTSSVILKRVRKNLRHSQAEGTIFFNIKKSQSQNIKQWEDDIQNFIPVGDSKLTNTRRPRNVSVPPNTLLRLHPGEPLVGCFRRQDPCSSVHCLYQPPQDTPLMCNPKSSAKSPRNNNNVQQYYWWSKEKAKPCIEKKNIKKLYRNSTHINKRQI